MTEACWCELQLEHFSCLGIDPASNVVAVAQQRDCRWCQGYWPESAVDLDEQFEIIICMNVVAHVDEPLAFLRACTEQLSSTGRLLIQPSQARMFENGEFGYGLPRAFVFFQYTVNDQARSTGRTEAHRELSCRHSR